MQGQRFKDFKKIKLFILAFQYGIAIAFLLVTILLAVVVGVNTFHHIEKQNMMKVTQQITEHIKFKSMRERPSELLNQYQIENNSTYDVVDYVLDEKSLKKLYDETLHYILSVHAYTAFIIDQSGNVILDKPAHQAAEDWEMRKAPLFYQIKKLKNGWLTYPSVPSWNITNEQNVLYFSSMDVLPWIVVVEGRRPTLTTFLNYVHFPNIGLHILCIFLAAILFIGLISTNLTTKLIDLFMYYPRRPVKNKQPQTSWKVDSFKQGHPKKVELRKDAFVKEEAPYAIEDINFGDNDTVDESIVDDKQEGIQKLEQWINNKTDSTSEGSTLDGPIQQAGQPSEFLDKLLKDIKKRNH